MKTHARTPPAHGSLRRRVMRRKPCPDCDGKMELETDTVTGEKYWRCTGLWVSADGSTVDGPVLGWLQLEDAARLLGPKCSLCDRRPARGGNRQGSALCQPCFDAD